MDDKPRRKELAHFLRTHRESLSPLLFHLPDGAKRRRTAGLRREEVAQLGGLSLTWYTKLEQAQEIQVSVQVLEGLTQAGGSSSDKQAGACIEKCLALRGPMCL